MSRSTTPRSRLGIGCLVALASPAGPVCAQEFTVELLAAGLDYPIQADAPCLGDERVFIVEQRKGRVRVLRNGNLLNDDFLNVAPEINTWLEGGLLAFAFHPDHAANGRVFVALVDLGGHLVVREYAVSERPDVAHPSPVQEILRLPQPHPIHNGGHLAFGPDGKLYLSIGDGGPGGDPNGRAQNLANLFGSILRLDVDLPAPFVPADNPFVGVAGAEPAIWAYGLRNPWSFQFDSLTGDLWIGDVGQSTREEVDFLPLGSGSGANFGWRCREGSHCFDATCCANLGFVEPLYEYLHIGGKCAVIGGGVYRGARMPALQGAYLCGDYCSRELFLLRQQGGVLTSVELRPPPLFGGFPAVQKLHAFGFDGEGEVLLIDGGSGPSMGRVFRLVPKAGVAHYCTAGTNSLGNAALLDSEGPPSLSTNALALTVQGGVPGQNGLFFYGARFQAEPFGDGTLCVGGTSAGIFRIPRVIQLGTQGQAFLALDFADDPFGSGAGQLTPASTWFFQFWYRDPASTETGVNLSDALALTFAP